MGGESGPCRKSLRARREVQVGQEGDSSMTWSNRERMGDRVGERVTEQCKLKWDGMVPPTRIERATRGLGNRPGQFLKRSVYQMVSPFLLRKQVLVGIPLIRWIRGV